MKSDLIYISILFGLLVCCKNEIFPFALADDHPNAKLFAVQNASFKVLDPATFLPCIKLKGRIEFQVTPGQHVGSDVIQIPETALAEGHCESLWQDYQDIKLSWNTTIPKEDGTLSINSFSIYFGFVTEWESDYSDLSISSKDYALNSVTVTYPSSLNNSYPITLSVSDFIALQTPKNRSYVCSKMNLKLGDLIINIYDLRIQAFSLNNQDLFDSNYICDDDAPKSVWHFIVEGLKWFFLGFFAFCLLGLILVLLAGVFFKRHDIVAIGYSLLGNSHSEA